MGEEAGLVVASGQDSHHGRLKMTFGSMENCIDFSTREC